MLNEQKAGKINNKHLNKMTMEYKIVEYGTKFTVTVFSASEQVITVIADEIKEGFVLVGHGEKTLPAKGDKGTIVFERGGPHKGHWKYYPE